MIKLLKWFGNNWNYNKEKIEISRRLFIFQPAIFIIMSGQITPHFSTNEMKCPESGICEMDDFFMNLLERIRIEFNQPMIVTSGFRSKKYNEAISKTGKDGPHTTGKAADFLICGLPADNLISIAKRFGISGIGIKQHGPYNKRFIHLDCLANSDKHPRPILWTYP